MATAAVGLPRSWRRVFEEMKMRGGCQAGPNKRESRAGDGRSDDATGERHHRQECARNVQLRSESSASGCHLGCYLRDRCTTGTSLGRNGVLRAMETSGVNLRCVQHTDFWLFTGVGVLMHPLLLLLQHAATLALWFLFFRGDGGRIASVPPVPARALSPAGIGRRDRRPQRPAGHLRSLSIARPLLGSCHGESSTTAKCAKAVEAVPASCAVSDARRGRIRLEFKT
jgi:hypothetical protein